MFQVILERRIYLILNNRRKTKMIELNKRINQNKWNKQNKQILLMLIIIVNQIKKSI